MTIKKRSSFVNNLITACLSPIITLSIVPHMNIRFVRLLRYIWASPCTMLALIPGVVTLLLGGSIRRVGHTIEASALSEIVIDRFFVFQNIENLYQVTVMPSALRLGTIPRIPYVTCNALGKTSGGDV